MTEDEMKKTWCPMARVAKPKHGNGYNRWVDDYNESLASNSQCIGSACAVWRWLGAPIEQATGYTMGFVPEGEGWRCTLSDKGRRGFVVKSTWERDAVRQGYCGMGGKP